MSGSFYLFLTFLVILGVVIALTCGIGFLLYWLLPNVELGMALLAGTAMLGLALYLFLQLLRSFHDYRLAELHEELEDQVALTVPPRAKRNRRR